MNDNKPGWRAKLAAGAIVVVAGLVAIAPLIPPAPPSDPAPTDFSAERAFVHIEAIATEPRPIGSAASERARASIVDELEKLGLEPDFQAFDVPDFYGGSSETRTVVNVMARIRGTMSTGAVALMGHYDTVPTTIGANDNASAVAIILEAARAILSSPPLHNDVILLFTDGEEPSPRFGSTAFVNHHPWADDVAFVINLEAIGYAGPSTPIEISGSSQRIANQYADAAPYPTAFSYLTATSKLIGGSNTDFSVFRDRGVPGVDVAYLHGSPIYHTMSDSPDRVSLRTLNQHGSNTLAVARRVADLDLRETPTESAAVFFTIGRFSVVRYPTAMSLPLVLLAGLVLAVAGWRRGRWGEIVGSVAITASTAIAAAVMAVGIWTVLGGWRDSMGVPESYLYLFGLVILITAIGSATGRWRTRRSDTHPAGVVISWWLLAILALAAPGMDYLFVWPALAGGLALLLLRGANEYRARLAAFGLVTLVTLVLLVPAIDTFYQLVQPRPGNPDSEIFAIVAVPALLISLVVELLRAFHPSTVGR